MEDQSMDPRRPDAGRPGAGAQGAEPPALDDDADVVDAEIVETVGPLALPGGLTTAPSIAPDYSEAGVPSLDYLRNKIEGRYGTALGSTELAEAAAAREAVARAEAEHRAAVTAQEQRAAREQAAKDKLDEIRRSIPRGS